MNHQATGDFYFYEVIRFYFYFYDFLSFYKVINFYKLPENY